MGGQILVAGLLMIVAVLGAILVDSNGNQVAVQQAYPMQLEQASAQSDKLFQTPLTVAMGFLFAVAAGLTFWGYGGALALAYNALLDMELYLNKGLHPFEFAFLITQMLGAYGAMVLADAGGEEAKTGHATQGRAAKALGYIAVGAVLTVLVFLARNAMIAVQAAA